MLYIYTSDDEDDVYDKGRAMKYQEEEALAAAKAMGIETSELDPVDVINMMEDSGWDLHHSIHH